MDQTGNEMESPVNRSRAPGNKESEREDGNTGRTKGREIGSREEQRLTEDGRSGARFEGRGVTWTSSPSVKRPWFDRYPAPRRDKKT